MIHAAPDPCWSRHWALCLLGALLALFALPGNATADDYPPVLAPLIAQGVTIQDHFEAPGNMEAYVGTLRGQAVAMYVTADGQHVVIGSMLDADGNNLTQQQIRQRVTGPRNAQAWDTLENSSWVLDGQRDAPVVIYAFTDPNCPYCHRFREQASPWIDAGKVQIRHIVVGILGGDSLSKAATIIDSDDPSAALVRNEARFDKGGIEVDDQEQLDMSAVLANNQLMNSLGLRGTPSIYYHDSAGNIRLVRGLPSAAQMEEVMGGPQS